MTKRPTPSGAGKSAAFAEARVRDGTMTENSNSNDDTGAGQIAMTDDLFGLPGDGVHWTWQRCGRYEYRKVLMHSTNPDHLVPSTTSLTDIPPLRAADGYAGGRPRGR
jgi:hypothetical protein